MKAVDLLADSLNISFRAGASVRSVSLAGGPGDAAEISLDPPIFPIQKNLADAAGTCLRPSGGSTVNHSLYVYRNKHTRRDVGGVSSTGEAPGIGSWPRPKTYQSLSRTELVVCSMQGPTSSLLDCHRRRDHRRPDQRRWTPTMASLPPGEEVG